MRKVIEKGLLNLFELVRKNEAKAEDIPDFLNNAGVAPCIVRDWSNEATRRAVILNNAAEKKTAKKNRRCSGRSLSGTG